MVSRIKSAKLLIALRKGFGLGFSLGLGHQTPTFLAISLEV